MMQRLRAACASASLPSHNAPQNKKLHNCLISVSRPHDQLCLKIFLLAVLHKELGNAEHLGWKRPQKLLCPPCLTLPSPPPTSPRFYTEGAGAHQEHRVGERPSQSGRQSSPSQARCLSLSLCRWRGTRKPVKNTFQL